MVRSRQALPAPVKGWRARTELSKDAGSQSYVNTTRDEDAGERWSAAARLYRRTLTHQLIFLRPSLVLTAAWKVSRCPTALTGQRTTSR
jgi:hypothetical protein